MDGYEFDRWNQVDLNLFSPIYSSAVQVYQSIEVKNIFKF